MIQNIRVLIADSDAEAAHALGQELVRRGYFCELARTASATLSSVMPARCDIVVCDVALGLATIVETTALYATRAALADAERRIGMLERALVVVPGPSD